MPELFLDCYGIYPGQAGRNQELRGWLQEPPVGIRLSVQPAPASSPLLRPGRPDTFHTPAAGDWHLMKRSVRERMPPLVQQMNKHVVEDE